MPTGSTFTRHDVIHKRIDVFAQYSLLRMFKGDAATRADGEAMLEAVKANQLAGIYKENELIPVMRAKSMSMGWWQLIPKGEDAALIGHPGDLVTRAPIIVFRDGIRSTPPRLDRALRKAWRSFQLLKSGSAKCTLPTSDMMLKGRQSFGTPLGNTVPRAFCQVSSISPRDIVAFANGYPNPYIREDTEIDALKDGVWDPSNPDFEAIAKNSNSTLRVAVDSLQTLLNVLNAELPGSIRRLYLVGHSSPRTFSFSGEITPKFDSKGRRLRDKQGVAVPPTVTFHPIEAAINAQNLKKEETVSFIARNSLPDRFAPGGEIILFGCKAGAGTSLMSALSDAFSVCVRGFRKEICVYMFHRGNQITRRGRMKYDPTLKRKCLELGHVSKVPFVDQLEQFVPDMGPVCTGGGVPSPIVQQRVSV
jgi:hypothetical protein